MTLRIVMGVRGVKRVSCQGLRVVWVPEKQGKPSEQSS